MSAHAAIRPLRRGACPGLSAPMQTGDGLLVRLLPVGTVALDAFAGLCTAAKQHGNGIVEITARGSIQIRGLSAASAPLFATQLAALGIAAQEGVPVLTGSLAGIGAEDILDAAALAADLRKALARIPPATLLSPKVSVVIDGGGMFGLDDIAADIRFSAQGAKDEVKLHVAVGGDEESAVHLGVIAPADGVETAVRLLEVISRHGRTARARDIVASEGVQAFQAALGAADRPSELSLPGGERVGVRGLGPGAVPSQSARSETIGLHTLRGGLFACGVGLAFGHAQAATLEHLIEAAKAAGASGLRAAPGRAFLIVGLVRNTADTFAAAAERLGFIVRAGDPRRSVIACAGAPLCASGHIAARVLAPLVTELAQFPIHVSGCIKGCAQSAPAVLTIVGTPNGCALVVNGSARDTPFAVVSNNELIDAVAEYARQQTAEQRHV